MTYRRGHTMSMDLPDKGSYVDVTFDHPVTLRLPVCHVNTEKGLFAVRVSDAMDFMVTTQPWKPITTMGRIPPKTVLP